MAGDESHTSLPPLSSLLLPPLQHTASSTAPYRRRSYLSAASLYLAGIMARLLQNPVDVAPSRTALFKIREMISLTPQ